MPNRPLAHTPIENFLRRLPPRDELVQRLALLGVADWPKRDDAFAVRVNRLQLQLQPNPGELGRILAEAGRVAQSLRSAMEARTAISR